MVAGGDPARRGEPRSWHVTAQRHRRVEPREILATATALTEKAKTEGEVKPEVTPGDLLKLANAIALAAEETPEEADHLLRLALTGIH